MNKQVQLSLSDTVGERVWKNCFGNCITCYRLSITQHQDKSLFLNLNILPILSFVTSRPDEGHSNMCEMYFLVDRPQKENFLVMIKDEEFNCLSFGAH